MKTLLREQAIKLRIEQEFSYSEIKKRLGVPKSTLSYWLKDYPLSENKILELRRSGWGRGEASRERYRNTMRQKREIESKITYQKYKSQFNNISRSTYFVAGLMLYLAEGDKKNYSRVSLANTDYKTIRFFIWWMIEYLGAEKQEIKVQLHLYPTMNIEREKIFWMSRLDIKSEQFYKPSLRRLQANSFTYKESFRHGTCSVYLLGVKRKTEIMMAIKAFLDKSIFAGI